MSRATNAELQSAYLNDLRKRHITVLVYLTNGTRQFGHIQSFDHHTILLVTGSNRVMLQKHFITTVMPVPKAQAAAVRRHSDRTMEPGTQERKAPEIIRKVLRRKLSLDKE